MQDKISIIIVTLNADAYLQNCLDSIRMQKYPNIEVVIADGKSTDKTVEIIKKNEDIISYWVSEKDKGIYDAMNKAITLATGKWIYFLGADDILLSDFSSMANELKQENEIYYGSVLRKDEKYYGFATAYRFAKHAICHQAIIYPAKVFREYKFDTRYKISADYVLNMQTWKDINFNWKFKDYIIANFNHTGVSSHKDLLLEKNMLSLVFDNFGFLIWLRFAFKKVKARILFKKR